MECTDVPRKKRRTITNRTEEDFHMGREDVEVPNMFGLIVVPKGEPLKSSLVFPVEECKEMGVPLHHHHPPPNHLQFKKPKEVQGEVPCSPSSRDRTPSPQVRKGSPVGSPKLAVALSPEHAQVRESPLMAHSRWPSPPLSPAPSPPHFAFPAPHGPSRSTLLKPPNINLTASSLNLSASSLGLLSSKSDHLQRLSIYPQIDSSALPPLPSPRTTPCKAYAQTHRSDIRNIINTSFDPLNEAITWSF
uniref:Uncharacterized protein n=1 Tax=Arcella intermedia TaxID=1963864 RepID=A0A6B2LCP2_9EUKA